MRTAKRPYNGLEFWSLWGNAKVTIDKKNIPKAP